MLRALLALGAGAVGFWAYKRFKEPSPETLYGVTDYEPPTYTAPTLEDARSFQQVNRLPARSDPESPAGG